MCTNEWKAYANLFVQMYPKHPCLDWKSRFSRTCNRVVSVTPLRETDLFLVFPLSDTILSKWLSLVSIHWNPWFAWISHLPLHYCQISLLIAVNFWFLVFPMFFKYDRAVILSMQMWIDIASFFFNVEDIIANLTAFSSKKFVWNFRSSKDHGPSVARPWQFAPQACNDSSEINIIWCGAQIKDLFLQRVKFLFHHSSSFLASIENVTFSSKEL